MAYLHEVSLGDIWVVVINGVEHLVRVVGRERVRSLTLFRLGLVASGAVLQELHTAKFLRRRATRQAATATLNTSPRRHARMLHACVDLREEGE